MPATIVPATLELIEQHRLCLDEVAREKCYIEMIEAPSLENLMKFQKNLLEIGAPNYLVLMEGEVVGWCDISLSTNPRTNHRGHLGIGLVAKARGQGLGRRLIEAALEHARKMGLEQVELTVYTSNKAAIALYERAGFIRQGVMRNYRKLDGVVYDCLAMVKVFV